MDKICINDFRKNLNLDYNLQINSNLFYNSYYNLDSNVKN